MTNIWIQKKNTYTSPVKIPCSRYKDQFNVWTFEQFWNSQSVEERRKRPVAARDFSRVLATTVGRRGTWQILATEYIHRGRQLWTLELNVVRVEELKMWRKYKLIKMVSHYWACCMYLNSMRQFFFVVKIFVTESQNLWLFSMSWRFFSSFAINDNSVSLSLVCVLHR